VSLIATIRVFSFHQRSSQIPSGPGTKWVQDTSGCCSTKLICISVATIRPLARPRQPLGIIQATIPVTHRPTTTALRLAGEQRITSFLHVRRISYRPVQLFPSFWSPSFAARVCPVVHFLPSLFSTVPHRFAFPSPSPGFNAPSYNPPPGPPPSGYELGLHIIP
jgi:hypothetical protein